MWLEVPPSWITNVLPIQTVPYIPLYAENNPHQLLPGLKL